MYAIATIILGLFFGSKAYGAPLGQGKWSATISLILGTQFHLLMLIAVYLGLTLDIEVANPSRTPLYVYLLPYLVAMVWSLGLGIRFTYLGYAREAMYQAWAPAISMVSSFIVLVVAGSVFKDGTGPFLAATLPWITLSWLVYRTNQIGKFRKVSKLNEMPKARNVLTVSPQAKKKTKKRST
jgi:hypothetical protein